MKTRNVRHGAENLFGFEIAQINARDAVIRVVVDEQPTSVVIAFGSLMAGWCTSP